MNLKSFFYPSLLLIIISSSFFIISCRKSDNKGDAHLQVYLTDDPGNYEAVLIDVKDVQINVTGNGDAGWQSLAGVKAGVYNLLDLVNDKDTLLADALIPSGKLHQIRLILGTENYVKIAGQSIQLETPSAQQSGLKLNVQQNVAGGILYTVVLDFDVAKSIVTTGNGKFILKPVIRTVLQAAGGSIRGFVTPDSVVTSVLVLQGLDTIASTYTGVDGGYLIKGLDAGTYSLHFLPSDNTFKNETREAVVVNTGIVVVTDTVHLQQ
jgi:hypothetical protein